MAIQTKNTSLAKAAGGLTTALLGLGVLTASLVGQSATADPEQHVTLTEPSLAVLESPAGDGDRLPSVVAISDLGDGGLDASSLRFLTTFEGAGYWLGYDEAGQVCLIAHLYDEQISASACNTVSEFMERGIQLGVGGSDQATSGIYDARLLPNSLAATVDDKGAPAAEGLYLRMVSAPDLLP